MEVGDGGFDISMTIEGENLLFTVSHPDLSMCALEESDHPLLEMARQEEKILCKKEKLK